MREALETPPPNSEEDTSSQQSSKAGGKTSDSRLRDRNSHVHLNLTAKEKIFLQNTKWKTLQAKKRIRRLLAPHSSLDNPEDDLVPGLRTSQTPNSNPNALPGVFNLCNLPAGVKTQNYYALVAQKAAQNFGELTEAEKHEFYYAFTKIGFKESLGTGQLPDGSTIEQTRKDKWKDKHGIVRDEHGPFWPPDYGPLYPAQNHRGKKEPPMEPLVVVGTNGKSSS